MLYFLIFECLPVQITPRLLLSEFEIPHYYANCVANPDLIARTSEIEVYGQGPLFSYSAFISLLLCIDEIYSVMINKLFLLNALAISSSIDL